MYLDNSQRKLYLNDKEQTTIIIMNIALLVYVTLLTLYNCSYEHVRYSGKTSSWRQVSTTGYRKNMRKMMYSIRNN